jgi:hypothetical protein
MKPNGPFLVQVITDDGYWSSTDPFEKPAMAQAFAKGLRKELVGKPGYIGVRVINLAHALRR